MSGTPKSLGSSGRELYARVLADVAPTWELDSKDLHNLEAAARAVDRVDELEQIIARDGLLTADGRVSPAVVECRLQTQLATLSLAKVETEPKISTRHLNGRQRAELRRLGNGAA